jgi:hypothetical protein
MIRIRTFVAAGLLTGLGLTVYATALSQRGEAQEKKGSNIQDPPKDVKDADTTKGLQDLELAWRLIQYGRNHKHPESLLIAAQILHRIPTQTLKVGHQATAEKEAKTAAAPTVDNSPKALVAEAKKLSASPAVKNLAIATQATIDEESRGALGGPKVDSFVIQPFQTITWNPITFVGGQRAVIHINNGVFGNMVLEAIDEFGNVVARDNVPGSYFRVEWFPRWTGSFRLRLRNLDSIAFSCGLGTN